MRLLYSLLLVVLGLAGWSSAASATEALSLFPECAQICLFTAFGAGTCSLGDQVCVCTNEGFQHNVTLCVAASCTIPDALMTKNATLATCGVPLRDRGGRYVALSNIMVSIAAVFVAIRFGYKILVARAEISWDDWTVLAAQVTAVASAVITVFGTVKHGLGQDIWALQPEEITEMLKYFYIMAVMYFTQVTLLKLTLTFFYIRVFPGAGVQRILWGTVVLISLWGFTFIVTAIFQCQPIHYFWTKWDGLHQGRCVDVNAIANSNAGLSIALDFWILGIPLWQLKGLKMNWKKKVGVAAMFCVGTFVTVVSILRLTALVHFAASSNASWEFYDVSVWSTVEIAVGIMCACLPTMRLLLVKLFPILGGSSIRSRQNYYNYRDRSGTDHKLQSMGKSSKPGKGIGVTSSCSHAPGTSSPPLGGQSGITIESSYTVRHTTESDKLSKYDTDEASLVSHGTVKEPL